MMKKQTLRWIAALLAAICPALCMGQSNAQNYLLTRTFTAKDGSSSLEQVAYFDGLGRPSQTVSAGITPTGKDLVTLQEYDSQGRESLSWLPVTSTGNGAFMELSALKSDAGQQYGGDARPYTQTLYEASPLGRPVSECGPGSAWASKPVRHEYGIAAPRSFASEIGHLPTGSYPYVRTTDDNSEDDLAAVHSPLSSTPLPGTAYTDLEDDFSYAYRYNPFHQRVMDKRPGCEAVYYMYDKGGRLIFSQDGEQRERGEWTFAMPDVFGRTLLTGTCTNKFSYDDYPFINIVTEATRTNATNALYGHTVSGVTLENAVVHSVSFYDDYSFIGRNGIPSSLNYATPPLGYGTRYTGGYKGTHATRAATRACRPARSRPVWTRTAWRAMTIRPSITMTGDVSSRPAAPTTWAARTWSMWPTTSRATP